MICFPIKEVLMDFSTRQTGRMPRIHAETQVKGSGSCRIICREDRQCAVPAFVQVTVLHVICHDESTQCSLPVKQCQLLVNSGTAFFQNIRRCKKILAQYRSEERRV